MTEYQLYFLPAAKRDIDKLDPYIAERIYNKIESVLTDPYGKTLPLVNMEGQRKLRAGSFRVILSINDEKIIVTVVKIGHRKNVYK